MSKVVAIHQPNFLPYLGYLNQIYNSDTFVFLDNVTYTKNDYINRNRIKTPDGWCWLTVPVVNKNILKTPICKVKIDNSANWRKKHWSSIKFNYGRTPYFGKYKDLFEETYCSEWDLLAELNKYLIKEVCKFLGISGNFVDASALNVGGSGTDLLVKVCEVLGADAYFSGRGGYDYLHRQKFEQHGIQVVFQDFQLPAYPQLFGEFIPNLSVLDYLFNVGASTNEKHYI